jgi:hypothetical protein
LPIAISRAFENRVLWLMVDSDFSEANPIGSNFYALRGSFFRRFFAAKKATKKFIS